MYISLTGKPVMKAMRKNSLRRQEKKETVRGKKLEREPIVIWVTQSLRYLDIVHKKKKFKYVVFFYHNLF